MIRELAAFIIGVLILHPCGMEAQELAPNKTGKSKSNRVYVKIIMPTILEKRDKDRSVIESWIAKDLRKMGRAKFIAVTKWVPVELDPSTGIPVSDVVWDGGEHGDIHYCPVAADIPNRAEGHISVLVDGWGPGRVEVTISMPDEPGSRGIAAVKECKTELGTPYVAVLIGPPPEDSIVPTKAKK